MDCKGCKPRDVTGADEAQEVFQRVWSRVTPEEQACPIVIAPHKKEPQKSTGTQAQPAGALQAQIIPEPQAEDVVCPSPMPTAPVAKEAPPVSVPVVEEFYLEETVPVITGMENGTDEVITDLATFEAGLALLPRMGSTGRPTAGCHCQSDFPPQSCVPCLGSQSAHFSELLQDMIRKELQGWAYYRSLAKRAGGIPARSFSLMAADDWQKAKRLSAAYFLISGVLYWPEKQSKVNIPSYLSALRQKFLEEQQDAAYYTAAATETTDDCLRQLFLDLADDNHRHTQQLRSLAEQL